MSLRAADRENFETLRVACKSDALALMECSDTKTGEYRAVICAVNVEDDGTVSFVPLGHLCTGNPYEAYTPPAPEVAGNA